MSNLSHSHRGRTTHFAVSCSSCWCYIAAAIVTAGISHRALADDALADQTIYLSDEAASVLLHPISGDRGDFGRDTAAAVPGRPGSPMLIGDKTYQKGLGRHANGEIVVELGGQYSQLHTVIGVQWQGDRRPGERGLSSPGRWQDNLPKPTDVR